MEITIHTGSIGSCNKIHVNWFDENGVQRTNMIEVDVLDIDKPRTICLKLDGKLISTLAGLPLPEQWCKHIAVSSSGQYCYNGMDVRHWAYCPKCGKQKPSCPVEF